MDISLIAVLLIGFLPRQPVQLFPLFFLSHLLLPYFPSFHSGVVAMSKFTPTAQEVAVVNQIFAQADPQKLGVVTGDAAVKVFSGTKLSPTVLAEVWALADEDNNGVLTRKGVAIAVRLLGHAQRGERVTEALVQQRM